MTNSPDPVAGPAATEPDASTILGLSFDDQFRAKEFQLSAYRLMSQHEIELLDTVTIVKSPEGKTHVIETIDPSPGSSALSGGMWAGLFGLILGGPIGWVAGAAVGAGVGAVSAKIVDLGLPDAWVDWFRDAVQPGTTTVVLLLGRIDQPVVLEELERFAGARLVYANVPADMVGRIRTAIADPSTGALTQEPETAPPTADV